MASAGRKRSRFQAKVDEALDTAIGPKLIFNLFLNSPTVTGSDLAKARWFNKLIEEKNEWTAGVSTNTTVGTAGGYVLGEVTSMIWQDFATNQTLWDNNKTGQASRAWLDYVEISGHWLSHGQATVENDWKNLGMFDLVFELWMMNAGDIDFSETLTTEAKYDTLFGKLCADHFGFDQDAKQSDIPPRMLFNNYKFGDVLGPKRATRLATKTMTIRTFRADSAIDGSITDNLSATATVGMAMSSANSLCAGVIPTQFVNMSFDINRWVEFYPAPFGSDTAKLAARPIFLTVRSNSYSYLGRFDPDTTYVRIKYHEALNRKVV